MRNESGIWNQPVGDTNMAGRTYSTAEPRKKACKDIAGVQA